MKRSTRSRRAKVASLALGFSSVCGAITVAKPLVSLDELLRDFNRTCEGSPAYNALASSLSRRYTHDGPRRGSVELPADLRSSFGRAVVINEGDHTVVRVPLRDAAYRGLPVQGLLFGFGHSNGVNVRGISLAVPAVTASSRWKDEAQQANAKVLRDMAEVTAPGAVRALIRPRGRDAEFVCDLST